MPAGRVTEELKRLGVPPDEEVVILRKQDLIDVMKRIRRNALRRGATDKVADEVLRQD
jgi:hypothetical protein